MISRHPLTASAKNPCATDFDLGRFRTASDIRVYAIGDVHGRLDLLDDLLARIAADKADRPPVRCITIFLGDLIDRGPASQGVIDRAMALAGQQDCLFLMGNHEESLIRAWSGAAEVIPDFLRYGGDALLHSYGWSLDGPEMAALPAAAVIDQLRARIPAAHIDFIRSFPDYWRCGDIFFAHAGVRPGLPLDAQDPVDLRWIRGDFTRSRADFGALIVHGHSITPKPDMTPNRIGIDTGAYQSGRLTALGLEGSNGWILST